MRAAKRSTFYFFSLRWVFPVLAGLWISGCATIETPSTDNPQTPVISTSEKGIYHKVRKGETIWRIAKSYQVPLDAVIKANNIPNVAHVDENQLILIPGAAQVMDLPPQVKEDPNREEFAWPLKGRIISYYGERKGSSVNRGIIIEGREGDTVMASRQGKVVFADYLNGYQQTVMIDHQDGYLSVYSQNQKLLVNLGDTIYKGAPIAQVGRQNGQSGIHFEIRRNAVADNPLFYLPKI